MYSQEIERRRIPVQTYGEMYTECEYSKKKNQLDLKTKSTKNQ